MSENSIVWLWATRGLSWGAKVSVFKGTQGNTLWDVQKEDKRRISLGIKQCIENPWETFNKDFKVNQEIEGEIKNIELITVREKKKQILIVDDIPFLNQKKY